MLLSSVARRGFASTTAGIPGHNFYDVAIVGGGVVGNVMACALASEPVFHQSRIALIEAGPASSGRSASSLEQWSNRVTSWNPSSIQLLRDYHIWNHVDITRVRPYKHMQVWDATAQGKISFDASDIGAHSLASIIELQNVVGALNERLDSVKNVTRMYGRHVKTIFLPSDKVSSLELAKESMEDFPLLQPAQLVLSDDSEIVARLIIAADGAQSKVRQLAGLHTTGWSYNQHGLVATLKVQEDAVLSGLSTEKNTTAWQRFLPDGPVAMLPLADDYSSLVWSLPPHVASKLKKVSSETFCWLLNAAFALHPTDLSYLLNSINEEGVPQVNLLDEIHWRLEVRRNESSLQPSHPLPPSVIAVQDKSRAVFPLQLKQSSAYISHRLALIGDAAHVVHPLAGQGLNMGLGDVQCLANLLAQSKLNGQDIGDINVLRQYNLERMAVNLGMMSVIDSLSGLFGAQFYPVQQLRSFGLNVLDQLPMLKTSIMKLAVR